MSNYDNPDDESAAYQSYQDGMAAHDEIKHLEEQKRKLVACMGECVKRQCEAAFDARHMKLPIEFIIHRNKINNNAMERLQQRYMKIHIRLTLLNKDSA